jgi:hypothetical protein
MTTRHEEPEGWTDDLPWLGQYILNDAGEPVPATGLLSWGRWMGTAKLSLARTEVGEATVSTAFLGLDQGYFGMLSLRDPLIYKPLLWETMIFGGAWDRYCY